MPIVSTPLAMPQNVAAPPCLMPVASPTAPMERVSPVLVSSVASYCLGPVEEKLWTVPVPQTRLPRSGAARKAVGWTSETAWSWAQG